MFAITRTLILYLFLILMLRILGRRAPSQLAPFEIVLILLFGGMASQAIIDDDRSLTNVVLAMMTVALAHLAASTLKQKFASIGKIMDGTPIVIFSNGEWHTDNMGRMRIQHQDVLTQARKQGLEREDQIKYAILERNGAISIIKKI